MTQDKSVKLSIAQDQQRDQQIVLALCESRYHIYNDYRRWALTIIEMSEKWKVKRPENTFRITMIWTGEPPTRKKTIMYSCKLKKLLSGCLTYTAYYIVLLFTMSTKMRNKREAVQKAGEPLKPMRT